MNVDASQRASGTVAVKIGDKVVFNAMSSKLVAPASYQATVVTVAGSSSATGSQTDGQQYDWAATLQQNAVLVDTNGGNIAFQGEHRPRRSGCVVQPLDRHDAEQHRLSTERPDEFPGQCREHFSARCARHDHRRPIRCDECYHDNRRH